jgi:hypothetical protein
LENKRLHHLIEDQAFKFAGAFALPAESFSADLYSLSLDAFVSLKAKWKFAVGMMLKRCETLGIGKEESIQRLWRSLSSRGWRLNEPLDDEIPPEHPMLLADGLRFLIGQNLLSGEQIWYGCGLAAKDIEELSNLPPGTIDPAARGKVTMLPWQHQPASHRTDGAKAKLISFPGKCG